MTQFPVFNRNVDILIAELWESVTRCAAVGEGYFSKL